MFSTPPDPRFRYFSEQASAPATPAAGADRLYFDNAGALKSVNSSGTVTTYSAGGGSISGLTAGYIPVAASATSLVDSIIDQTSGVITVTGSLNVTSLIRAAAGAVGAPSITANGDIDTGFWFPAGNTIAASVNGAEGWRLSTSGVTVAGVLIAGSGPTTLTDSVGKILSASLNTVALANGGSGATDAATARSNFGLAIGTNVEAWDADLDALAALSATGGMLARTGAGAFAVRMLAGTANQITATNGDGVSGAPTFSLPQGLIFPGTYSPAYAAVSADTVLDATYGTIAVDASGAARTITLPAATNARQYVVIKSDSSANAVTVARAGADTIDGATSIGIGTQYQSFTFLSDGVSKWWVVNRKAPFGSTTTSPLQRDPTDITKTVSWDLSGLTTATNRVITVPDANISLMGPQIAGRGGMWVGTIGMPSGLITTTPSSAGANAIRFWSFTVPWPITIGHLSYEVTTGGGSSKKLAIGIYDSTGTSKLLAADNLDANTTGSAISVATSTVTLQPGTYLLGVGSDSATTVMRATGAANLHFVWNATSANVGTCAGVLSSGAMPSSLSTLTANTGQPGVPLILLER